MRRAVVRLVLVVVLVVPSWSDTPSPTPPTDTTPAAKPYTDSEFPTWVRKLRRAEIIAVGAFPIAYLLSGVGYDYYYYWSNGSPSDNIPWPMGPGTSQWTISSNGPELQRKNVTVIVTSAAIGVVIATIDWLLSP